MKKWIYRISPCLKIVGSESTSRGWLEAMRVIYDHELIIFTKSDFSTGIITGKGIENYNCPAGSFIIVPPGIRHISRETAGQNGHRHWIHFDWEYAGAASKNPQITYCPAKPRTEFLRPAPDYVPVGILRGEIRDIMKVMDILTRIDSLWNHGDNREQTIARGLLLELLLELLAPETENISAVGNTASRLASRARRELNNLAKTPLRDASSIEKCLKRNGFTYAHQCRIFKQYYGISPLQYVNELRISEIKNLLRDTSASISEIAGITGYDNLGYFSRIFKKHTGMSPRKYRNSSLW